VYCCGPRCGAGSLTPCVFIGGGGTTLRSPVYNLFPVDLRTPPGVSLEPLLGSGDEPLLSPSLPTLLLFECVLAYMTPSASNALIQWFVDYFGAPSGGLLGAVVYEMFKLEDSFGRVMLTNLKVGLGLPVALHVSIF
jgi:[phosphatase 2A protein]-leucine-carboxy methyltransferase